MAIKTDIKLFFPPKERHIHTKQSIETIFSLLDVSLRSRYASYNYNMSFQKFETGFIISLTPTFFHSRENLPIQATGKFRITDVGSIDLVMTYDDTSARTTLFRMAFIFCLALMAIMLLSSETIQAFLKNLGASVIVVLFIGFINFLLTQKTNAEAYRLNSEIKDILSSD